MRFVAPLMMIVLLLGACDDTGGSAGGGGTSGGAGDPAPQITTTTLPDAVINQPYTASVQCINGTAPFSWQIVEGVLPTGLTLSTSTADSVTIGGTPTSGGGHFFEIEVTDSLARSHRAVLGIHVTGAATYFGWPVAGRIIFVIDRSAETALATSTGPSRLDAAQARFNTLKNNLGVNHEFDVIMIGGSGEVSSVFGSAVIADSSNVAAANTAVQALTPSGPCAFYTGLNQALNSYGSVDKVVLLGGARPGIDTAAPGGSTDREEIVQAAQSWVTVHASLTWMVYLFTDDSEVGLLYQELTSMGSGAFYYMP